jgi:hypothetical protein
MLSQLLTIKKCRETGLRNRGRRIAAAIRSREEERQSQRTAQAQLRERWTSTNEVEQTLSPRDFQKLKAQLGGFYRDDQQFNARLHALADEISKQRALASQTAHALKKIMRGQEKLRAVMKEMK